MLTDYFDRVSCLNLDKRYAQRERLTGAFGPIEYFLMGDGKLRKHEEYDLIDEDPPAWMTWRHRGSVNAFRGFRQIILRAMCDGLENILLLEDDAEPVEGWEDQLESRWDHIPADWEMLYLGGNLEWGSSKTVAPGVLRVKGCLCFHAVALRSIIFNEVLNLPMEGPIDLMATRLQHRPTYGLFPWLINQRVGYSFIEGRDRDYSEFVTSKGEKLC